MPTPPSVSPALDALVELLRGRRIAVLTGAGISTESGIPDYRGPETRHVERRPIQYDEFVRDAEARRRYWARASRGWRRVAEARPNAGHRALARIEAAGLLTGLITQNVDGLHQRAGSRRVIELHGALADVVCLGCRAVRPRAEVQAQIAAQNPDHIGPALPDRRLAPDGDAELEAVAVARFRPPSCPACGGVLKPDVVFFGESVPKPRVAEAQRLVAAADVLVVAGSSLAVYSGYRFVRQAEKEGTPVAIVTLGETRGHRHAAVALDAPLGTALPALATALGA